MPAERPHRRLSLTQPTTPPQEDASTGLPTALQVDEAHPDLERAGTDSASVAEKADPVRVMAYLTEDEAQRLDELWISLRKTPARPSKSDILRGAFALALENRDELTAILSRQQSSTQARQKASRKG